MASASGLFNAPVKVKRPEREVDISLEFGFEIIIFCRFQTAGRGRCTVGTDMRIKMDVGLELELYKQDRWGVKQAYVLSRGGLQCN